MSDKVLSSRGMFPMNRGSGTLHRRTVRISPQNGGTFTPDSNNVLQFAIPAHGWVDFTNSYLSYNAAITTGGAAIATKVEGTYFSQGAASVIQNLQVYANGQIVEQINNFNLLNLLLHKVSAPAPHLDSMGSTMGYGSIPERQLWACGRQYSLPMVGSGILSGSHGKYMPLGKINGGMRVDVQLAPAAIATRQGNAAAAAPGYSYQLSNAYLCLDVVEFAPELEAAFDAALVERPLAIKYHTFTNFTKTLSGTSETVDLPIRTGSLNAAFAVFRDPTKIVVGDEALELWTCGGLTKFWFRVNGESMPSQQIDCDLDNWTQAYAELVKALLQYGSADYGSELSAFNYRARNNDGDNTVGNFVQGVPLAITPVNGQTGYVSVALDDAIRFGLRPGMSIHLGHAAGAGNAADETPAITNIDFSQAVAGANVARVYIEAITNPGASAALTTALLSGGDTSFAIGFNFQKDAGHDNLLDGIPINGSNPMSLELTRSAGDPDYVAGARCDVFVDTSRMLEVFADRSVRISI